MLARWSSKKRMSPDFLKNQELRIVLSKLDCLYTSTFEDCGPALGFFLSKGVDEEFCCFFRELTGGAWKAGDAAGIHGTCEYLRKGECTLINLPILSLSKEKSVQHFFPNKAV